MKKLIFLLFLTSCFASNENYNKNNVTLNFNDDLSFEEFKNLLEEYSKISSYPNIDK
jgi:hypothetical protein